MKPKTAVFLSVWLTTSLMFLNVGFGSIDSDKGYAYISRDRIQYMNEQNGIDLLAEDNLVQTLVRSAAIFLMTLLVVLAQPALWFGVKLYEIGFPDYIFYPTIRGLGFLPILWMMYYIFSIIIFFFTKRKLPLGYA